MARTATVENILQEKDFDTVWDYLEKKFGYSKEWRKECKAYIYDRQRLSFYKPNPITDFLFFCNRNINPLLNQALCRREGHPTFMRLLYVMFVEGKLR